MSLWNPAEHSDQENLTWCYLRAIEWCAWPAFVSHPFIPILFLFVPWLPVGQSGFSTEGLATHYDPTTCCLIQSAYELGTEATFWTDQDRESLELLDAR